MILERKNIMYNGYIYTPPEIIAREVAKEVKAPQRKDNGGVPSGRKDRAKLAFVAIFIYTCPIWFFALLLLLLSV